MNAEEPLQRACAPRLVGARGRRIHGQRELVCHAWIDGQTVRAASLPPSSAIVTAATGPVGISPSRVADARVRDINEAFCCLMGIARDETLGRNADELDVWAD